MEIKVCQGEREMAVDNKTLGQFSLVSTVDIMYKFSLLTISAKKIHGTAEGEKKRLHWMHLRRI